MTNNFYVGTAAWAIPKNFSEYFPVEGSHLERYAEILNAVEINSSFYRHHKPATYQRWAASVPADFRFSVKLFKYFTHEKGLRESGAELTATLAAILELKEKLGFLLVQLPPKLAWDPRTAKVFFHRLREIYSGPLALEPRHVTWNSAAAQELLQEKNISRVIADPDPIPNTRTESTPPTGAAYYRLHGSPEIYRSDYSVAAQRLWKERLELSAHGGRPVWCIFDNTTFGYATENAVKLTGELAPPLPAAEKNRILTG